VAQGLLPVSVHVKRAASRVLSQYTALGQGQDQGLDATARELRLLAARAQVADPAACPHLAAVRRAMGIEGESVPDWELDVLGRYDPQQFEELCASAQAAQQAWALLTDGSAPSPREAAAALRRLSLALQSLRDDAAGLTAAWAQVAAALEADAAPGPALALEASNSLLFLEALAQDVDPLDAQWPERLAQLAQRLRDALSGQAVAEPQPWMSELYRAMSQRRTLGSVVAQLRAELAHLEAALDGHLRNPGPGDLEGWPRRLDSLRGVLVMLGLPAAGHALATVRRTVEAWLTTDAPGAEERQLIAAEVLAPNLSVLGWLLETLERQPALAQDGFFFDETQGQLRSRMASDLAPEEGAPIDAGPPAGVDVPVDTPPTDLAAAAPAQSIAGPAQDGEAPDDDGQEELLAVFLDEAREVLELAGQAVAALRQHADALADLTALRRAFHTLKGSSRMVGLGAFGESAWAMEQLLNAWLADQKPADTALLDLAGEALATLGEWAEDLRAGRSASDRSAAVRASADALRLEGRHLPIAQPPVAVAVPPPPVAAPVQGPPGLDPELCSVFLDEAEDWSQRLCQGLAPGVSLAHDWGPAALERLAHQLAGASATVGHEALSRLARGLEHALGRLVAHRGPGDGLSTAEREALSQASEGTRQLLHQFAAGFWREVPPSWLEALDTVGQARTIVDAAPAPAAELPPEAPSLAEVAPLPEAEAVAVTPTEPLDHLDLDLFPVFEDEAQSLRLRLGAALRQWQADPADMQARAEVLRCLHTLKGSARLAGALRLGDMVHRLESQALALPEPLSDATAIQPLLQALDDIDLRFDALRAAFAPASDATVAAPAEGVRLEAAEGLVQAALGAAAAPVAPSAPVGAPAPLAVLPPTGPATVRVRTELLDRLMQQTGDVMTTRNRLDAEVRNLQQSFQEMGGNLDRLRLQLRELELQAETRVQSLQQPQRDSDSTFDPLEFDRYTRLQELTRLLAESINDVATVQRSLQRTVAGAEGSLAAQARQMRELQHDLLRTRLVAFDQMAERLHRLVRQTAEGQGKQVELQLAGADVEADRGVLERVLPVLEHLLRNAVVHGIEAPAVRQAAGKPALGRVVIALHQSGNDLMLSVGDDGAGLDLKRLRERAVAQGLWRPDQPLGETEALQAIFLPGLSSAETVSEVAGRGIGLDVARNEVLGLGGRIEACRAAEGGVGFRLVVPLTTAVTQVVMVRVGELSFGVPAPWVQLVRRAPTAELTAAYLSGQWREAGELMPFHWAGALLAMSPESQDPHAAQARSWPVLVFHSAGQQVAWHVDEVLGHQEVVVKPLGPQLVHLPGLAGATVLASGAVALIYNPVALSALYGEPSRRWVRQQREASRLASGRAGEGRRPAQAPLVLVVDDSVTVRRVTQRLLKREGYRVALATDGLQALERLREEAPVVVLCDIEMPRMDGFELLRQLRGDARWQTLPVVMITSRTADKHQDHARRMGADHYLGKPYAEDELLALVAGYARLAAPVD
jgi:chemosensory pili system protein ChpA (sensor histidine kinase/response regulator)